jgi:hypothetical protein
MTLETARWKRGAILAASCALTAVLSIVLTLRFAGPSEVSPEKLDSVRSGLERARTDADSLRTQLVQASLTQLLRAVTARDDAEVEKARKSLIEIGPPVVPHARELALKTAVDRVKRELIVVIEAFKDPESAAALTEIYLAQKPEHRAVKETAALALARLAIRSSAAGLGKLVRSETDPAFKTLLLRLYAPYAHTDPQGIPADPQIRQEIEKNREQGTAFSEIHGLDPSRDADFDRLESLIRSGQPPAVRLAALQKAASRKDARAAALFDQVARAPADDPGGLLRTNALSHLFRMKDIAAVSALDGLLAAPDAELRHTALLTAHGAASADHLPALLRVRDGEFPQEDRRLASEAVQRIQTQVNRKIGPEKK